jgi:hypothetical protein
VKKLGIKPETSLALVGAPPGFRKELVGLPPEVRILSGGAQTTDLTVWFVTAAAELRTRIAVVAKGMGAGLWIAWPKKASGRRTDLNEAVVRAAGLANGLVDYKVCAINETWSGLKFARRKVAKL